MISGLRDDILLQILSRLDTKTAVGTRIFSKRWRYLHLLLSNFQLTLERSVRLNYGQKNNRLVAFLKSFHAFANSQNHPHMTSLVVQFDYFNSPHQDLLQQCIKVALSEKLEHLELLNRSAQPYEFPFNCLSDEFGNRLHSLAISNCFVTRPHGFCMFPSLRKLVLYEFSICKDVLRRDSDQERFQLLLNSCASLEILSIIYCVMSSPLKIDAPYQLKELTIYHCDTPGIEIIRAPKLEKLECLIKCPYFGSYHCSFFMGTVPSLKYFGLGFGF